MPRTALHLTLALALVAAFSLGGCGRKGRLEPPPEQQVPVNKEGKKKDPGFERPKRSLPMDYLLN